MVKLADSSALLGEGSSRFLGTRFLVYPQPSFIIGYEQPEVVWLSPSPGEVLAGPSDRRMYVIDPVEPKAPYGFPNLPPYAGAVRKFAEPGPDGHFDHLRVGSDAFVCAHAYACTRRILDICEGYVGCEIPWFFEPSLSRLEIVPLIAGWENAHSGFGYLELGESGLADQSLFGLNFDAVAHETGHLILLGMLGLPRTTTGGPDFLAFHEANADFISLLGLLHFDTALDRILRRTDGNLLIHNELDRFAELRDSKRIRSFNNTLKLEDVGDEVHDRSRPFAAALFDGLVEVHQALMFERGLSTLNPRAYTNLRREITSQKLDQELARSRSEYKFRHFGVKAALADARDIVGEAVVQSWAALDPDTLVYADAANAVLDVLDSGRGRPFVNQMQNCFEWREIL